MPKMDRVTISSSVQQTHCFEKTFEICGMCLNLFSNSIKVFLGDGSNSSDAPHLICRGDDTPRGTVTERVELLPGK